MTKRCRRAEWKSIKADVKVFAQGLAAGIFIKTLKPCIWAEKRLFMRETRVISFSFAFVHR